MYGNTEDGDTCVCGRYLGYDFTAEQLEEYDCICPVCKRPHLANCFADDWRVLVRGADD